MTLTESNRRLLVLVALLKTVPDERFDYNRWVGRDWQGMPDFSCGTSACAGGWATTIPEFREEGLSLLPASEDRGGYIRYQSVSMPYPLYGYSALAECFGLTWSVAQYLFTPEDEEEEKYTAAQVAGKIEAFVTARVYVDDTDEA